MSDRWLRADPRLLGRRCAQADTSWSIWNTSDRCRAHSYAKLLPPLHPASEGGGRLYATGQNWTQQHWTWIRGQRFALPVWQRTFEATLFALEQALARVAELD